MPQPWSAMFLFIILKMCLIFEWTLPVLNEVLVPTVCPIYSTQKVPFFLVFQTCIGYSCHQSVFHLMNFHISLLFPPFLFLLFSLSRSVYLSLFLLVCPPAREYAFSIWFIRSRVWLRPGRPRLEIPFFEFVPPPPPSPQRFCIKRVHPCSGGGAQKILIDEKVMSINVTADLDSQKNSHCNRKILCHHNQI